MKSAYEASLAHQMGVGAWLQQLPKCAERTRDAMRNGMIDPNVGEEVRGIWSQLPLDASAIACVEGSDERLASRLGGCCTRSWCTTTSCGHSWASATAVYLPSSPLPCPSLLSSALAYQGGRTNPLTSPSLSRVLMLQQLSCDFGRTACSALSCLLRHCESVAAHRVHAAGEPTWAHRAPRRPLHQLLQLQRLPPGLRRPQVQFVFFLGAVFLLQIEKKL
eukprot:397447-Rhodomonas_salina.1